MKEKTYWLHVSDDGSEIAYAEPPTAVRTLRVEVVDAMYEQTQTYIVYPDGEQEKQVPPRGEGWVFDGISKDQCSCCWRRKRRRKER